MPVMPFTRTQREVFIIYGALAPYRPCLQIGAENSRNAKIQIRDNRKFICSQNRSKQINKKPQYFIHICPCRHLL